MGDFEWYCDKERNQKCNKVKFFKHHMKHGSVTKFLMNDKLEDVTDNNYHQSINQLSLNRAFNNHKSLHQSVEYSLNKQYRWKLFEDLSNDIESYNESDNVKVSLLEKRRRTWGVDKDVTKSVLAYHTVDEKGYPIHNYPSSSYANLSSIVPRKPKTKEDDIKTSKINNEPSVNILYEIVTPCSSSKEWVMENRKLQRWNKQWRRPVLRSAVEKRFRKEINEILIDTDNESDYCNQVSEESDDIEEQVRSECTVNILELMQITKDSDRKKVKKNNANASENLHPHVFNDGDFMNLIETNFQMVPVEVSCPIEDLESDSLKNQFGKNYFECTCIPRRFCIDISNFVTKVLSVAHHNSSQFIAKAICIFEVVPTTLRDLDIYDKFSWDVEDDDDDDCETIKLL